MLWMRCGLIIIVVAKWTKTANDLINDSQYNHHHLQSKRYFSGEQPRLLAHMPYTNAVLTVIIPQIHKCYKNLSNSMIRKDYNQMPGCSVQLNYIQADAKKWTTDHWQSKNIRQCNSRACLINASTIQHIGLSVTIGVQNTGTQRHP